jgi:biotin carboxyl carrier protein
MEDWEYALQEKLKRDRLRQQAHQFASPELRAEIEKHERELEEAETAKRKKQREESDEKRGREKTAQFFGVVVAIAIGSAIVAGAVYAVVKFVKWAWFN